MPIYKKYVDYFGDEKYPPYQISLLSIIKECDFDKQGTLEEIKSDIHKLHTLFEEFLESTEEGRKFIKEKVECCGINDTYYKEEKCQ
jgi:hypothetical protein